MAETLLLADANPTMQRVIELTCAEQGLKVVSVSDGQQALDYLLAERPALALISLTLPRLDGFEIARLVRDRPDLQRIPVLLLAGAFETIDEARVQASGAAGVLVKPFEPGLVIKRVKELLGMSKPDDQSTPRQSPLHQSGRLITSADAPTNATGDDSATPATSREAPRVNGAGAWRELRDSTGLGTNAVAVERDQLAARPETPRPVFEVDEEWFSKGTDSKAPDDPRGQGAQGAWSAEGAHGALTDATSVFETERVVDPIDWRAIQDEAPASVEATSAEAEPATPAVSEDFSPPVASALAREPVGATYGDPSPPAAGFPAAEAFAMLWAHEQGEPLPAVAPPPPVELSDQTVEAVATRMADQLTERVTGDLASRVTDGLAGRITEDLARRISERLTADLSARVSSGLAEQVAAHVAERMMQDAFGDSLRQTVHDVSERLVREEIARIRAAAQDSPH